MEQDIARSIAFEYKPRWVLDVGILWCIFFNRKGLLVAIDSNLKFLEFPCIKVVEIVPLDGFDVVKKCVGVDAIAFDFQ